MSLQIISEAEITSKTVCVFCKQNIVDELKYGPLYHREGVITHHFCMLFSAALGQSGQDNEGILGFMPHDIQKELRRGNRLKCIYCGAFGASIGCCHKRCKKAFHFPCGLKHDATFEFIGNYESYCEEHANAQKISMKKEDWTCPVCMGHVSKKSRPIQASCCKAAVFHKDCMQKVALNAGYFFKCPTCNASSNFTKEMRTLGIYVPLQDASWELEPNAYQDLLYQYSNCDAFKCNCSKGRAYSNDKGDWLLARCRICGASGIHKKCGALKNSEIDNWACKACLVVEKKAENDKLMKEAELKRQAELPCSSASVRNDKPAVSNLDGDEESFKMSDLVIAKSCISYFPYNKDQLSQYDSSESLPDWRNFTINVNLVNWIKPIALEPEEASVPKHSQEDESSKPKSKRGRKPKQPEPGNGEATKVKTKKNILIIEPRVSPLVESSTNGDNLKKASGDKIIISKRSVSAKKLKSLDSDKVSHLDLQKKNQSASAACQSNGLPTIIPGRPKQVKRQLSILPFVTNFLRMGELREKRKQDVSAPVEPSPCKKPLLGVDAIGTQSETEVSAPVKKHKAMLVTEKLNVPHNPFAKKLVLAKRSECEHVNSKPHKFTEVRENVCDNPPQSLVASLPPPPTHKVESSGLNCNAYTKDTGITVECQNSGNDVISGGKNDNQHERHPSPAFFRQQEQTKSPQLLTLSHPSSILGLTGKLRVPGGNSNAYEPATVNKTLIDPMHKSDMNISSSSRPVAAQGSQPSTMTTVRTSTQINDNKKIFSVTTTFSQNGAKWVDRTFFK